MAQMAKTSEAPVKTAPEDERAMEMVSTRKSPSQMAVSDSGTVSGSQTFV